MNTSCSIIVIVTLTTMLVSACAPSMAAASLPATTLPQAPAQPPASAPMARPASTAAIAGLWKGTMKFSDDPQRAEQIEVWIDERCAVGNACGYVDNSTVGCEWQLTYDGMQGQSFLFAHSKTLAGDCPAVGQGKYTLQPDGRLLREHTTPDFTARGLLTRKSVHGDE